MGRIIRTPQSRVDMFAIWDYVAERNPDSAEKLLRRIYQTFDRLAQQPGIGERHDEYRPGLRCFAVGKYVIYYLAHENCVEILRVTHAARDVKGLFSADE